MEEIQIHILLGLGIILLFSLVFEYLDHLKYSEGDESMSYMIFLVNIVSKGVFGASFVLPLILFTDWATTDHLVGGLMSIMFLAIFYINIHNLLSIPQRLAMILSENESGVTSRLSLPLLIIHPTLLLTWFRSNQYLYSRNSTRSYVLPFEKTEDAHEFVQQHKESNTGACSCCGEKDQVYGRYRGKLAGYNDYRLVSFEYGETKFGIASSMVIKMCENCWKENRKILTESDLVDEEELVAELL